MVHAVRSASDQNCLSFKLHNYFSSYCQRSCIKMYFSNHLYTLPGASSLFWEFMNYTELIDQVIKFQQMQREQKHCAAPSRKLSEKVAAESPLPVSFIPVSTSCYLKKWYDDWTLVTPLDHEDKDFVIRMSKQWAGRSMNIWGFWILILALGHVLTDRETNFCLV